MYVSIEYVFRITRIIYSFRLIEIRVLLGSWGFHPLLLQPFGQIGTNYKTTQPAVVLINYTEKRISDFYLELGCRTTRGQNVHFLSPISPPYKPVYGRTRERLKQSSCFESGSLGRRVVVVEGLTRGEDDDGGWPLVGGRVIFVGSA